MKELQLQQCSLIKLRLYRLVFVLVLRTVVLTLYDNPAGLMRDAHRRIGPVHVLATGATGAIRINAQIGWIDFNINIVIDLGRDKHRRE